MQYYPVSIQSDAVSKCSCNYRQSYFYQCIPLLMSSIESYLSNKPKQCILKKSKIEMQQIVSLYQIVIIVKMFFSSLRVYCVTIIGVIIVIVNGANVVCNYRQNSLYQFIPFFIVFSQIIAFKQTQTGLLTALNLFSSITTYSLLLQFYNYICSMRSLF